LSVITSSIHTNLNMAPAKCCISGFEWAGTPSGRVGKLGSRDAYISGDNAAAAVLIIPDLFGWDFANIRLLADHYARESNTTVFVPDFFGDDKLPLDKLLAEKYDEIDFDSYLARNGRKTQEPQMVACAKALRDDHGFGKVAAVGFCYGAWAAVRMGAMDTQGQMRTDPLSSAKPLVDCVTVGHPSMLTREDIDNISVPIQVLAPEHDFVYTPELKLYTFQKLQTRPVPFDYQHFPGVYHACLVRGDETKPGERAAMARAKNAAVTWMTQWLHGEE
jgi:dienelactone hydrolase